LTQFVQRTEHTHIQVHNTLHLKVFLHT